jgi:excisionase family DNA binding protein
MSDKEKPKEYLRVSEASKLLGVHANTLRNWDTQNILKPVRIGPRKERRYRRTDIIKFMNNQQVENNQEGEK